MSRFLLAIDQGTSSSRAVIYDHSMKVIASAQQEFPQIYPQPGWVEHDPEAIWDSVCAVMAAAMHDAGATDITAIGITNQRETTLVWERKTGTCVYNAIVWQRRRKKEEGKEGKREEREKKGKEKKGGGGGGDPRDQSPAQQSPGSPK